MQEISTDDAPPSIGPYSQAIEANGFLFVSGQGGVKPDTGEIISENVRAQTEQVFENITAILDEAGASTDDIAKATVFLTNMEDYDSVNEVYAEYMNEPFPARSAVQVADLPIDISVEVEVMAVAPRE